MALQEFKPRRSGFGGQWKDCIQITNKTLKFSFSFWEKDLGKAERIRVFYDSDKNILGLLPTLPESKEGFKVYTQGRYNPTLLWRTCVKFFNLHFDGRESFIVSNCGDDKEKMRMINLSKKCNGK